MHSLTQRANDFSNPLWKTLSDDSSGTWTAHQWPGTSLKSVQCFGSVPLPCADGISVLVPASGCSFPSEIGWTTSIWIAAYLRLLKEAYAGTLILSSVYDKVLGPRDSAAPLLLQQTRWERPKVKRKDQLGTLKTKASILSFSKNKVKGLFASIADIIVWFFFLCLEQWLFHPVCFVFCLPKKSYFYEVPQKF